MDLYDFPPRDLFEGHGVPVPGGIVARSSAQTEWAAERLGAPVVVVKAQVKTGGRGKAGGIKMADSPAAARAAAEAILGMDIKGYLVEPVLVAEGIDIVEPRWPPPVPVLLSSSSRRLAPVGRSVRRSPPGWT